MFPYIGAILLLGILLLLTLVVFLYLSGLFEPVHVGVRTPPFLSDPTWFAYKLHHGPYSEAGYLFTEAYSIDPSCIQCGIRYEKECLPAASVQSTEETAVKETEEDVSEASPEYCAVGSFVDEETMDEFKKHGYKMIHLPAVDEALVGSFPHTSFLSIPIGSARAKHSMHDYMEEHDLKVPTFLELYGNGYIHYVGLFEDTEAFNIPPNVCNEDESTEMNSSLNIEMIEAVDDVPSIPPSSDDPPSNGSEELDELDASFEKITEVPAVVT